MRAKATILKRRRSSTAEGRRGGRAEAAGPGDPAALQGGQEGAAEERAREGGGGDGERRETGDTGKRAWSIPSSLIVNCAPHCCFSLASSCFSASSLALLSLRSRLASFLL